MKQSKYRKQLNKVLVNYVERTQPLIEKYEDDVLQDKYEGNRAMERMLSGYADKRSKADSLENMLVCRFMSDEEKRGLANNLYKECRSWIANDNGFGIAGYVLSMAGDMFGAADKLKE